MRNRDNKNRNLIFKRGFKVHNRWLFLRFCERLPHVFVPFRHCEVLWLRGGIGQGFWNEMRVQGLKILCCFFKWTWKHKGFLGFYTIYYWIVLSWCECFICVVLFYFYGKAVPLIMYSKDDLVEHKQQIIYNIIYE